MKASDYRSNNTVAVESVGPVAPPPGQVRVEVVYGGRCPAVCQDIERGILTVDGGRKDARAARR